MLFNLFDLVFTLSCSVVLIFSIIVYIRYFLLRNCNVQLFNIYGVSIFILFDHTISHHIRLRLRTVMLRAVLKFNCFNVMVTVIIK